MIANNYFTDDKDLSLIFEHIVNWQAIVPAVEGEEFFDYKRYQETSDPRFELAPSSTEEAVDLYRSSLDSLGEFFGKEVSQLAPIMDKKGLQYADGKVTFPEEQLELYEKFKQTGLMSFAMPRISGGLGFPVTIGAFYTMIMARADVPFCMTMNLLNLAQIVSRYGTEEQNDGYASKASSGESLFAMALTEPDFGSDLNNVRTVATKQEDGSYRITGTKRFISQGCGLGENPALLLTLARTGSKKGARGLSLFLVKSSDIEVAGLEKKMGIHSSPTCEIVYENSYAELLGQEGLGLTRYTLGMTNFMRMGCAAGGPGGGAAGYYESLKYAQEREQFGKPIIQIPAVAEMLHKIKRETNATRLFALETAYVVDMYQHHQIRLEKQGKTDREIRRDERVSQWSNLAAIMTSVAKYYCAEENLLSGNLAIQIHGGAGYTEDYDVSRLYRDGRINTIYEGTSQLHVRLSTGGIVAGMTGDGFFKRYIDSLVGSLDSPSKYLQEQAGMFAECLSEFRMITTEEEKERVAENLIIIVARYISSILYERALGKIDDSDWQKDCQAYVIDSTAIMHASLYRVKHAPKKVE
ncbi:MAG: acyl-CoA dehydrogenase family protein [Spirochaetota bacterium]